MLHVSLSILPGTIRAQMMFKLFLSSNNNKMAPTVIGDLVSKETVGLRIFYGG